MTVFYENLDLNRLSELSFREEKNSNESYFALAILEKNSCPNSFDKFDFYTVDSDNYIKEYCLKTSVHNYNIILTDLEEIDEFDIDCYGVRVKKVNDGYEIDYGYYCGEFNVFEDGGDLWDFYSYDEPLNQYIIDKINNILAEVSSSDNQLQTLLNSKESAFDDYIKREYSLRLKEFYKNHDERDNYKLELESLLFDYFPDFDLYLEYCENFPKDCENKRDQLFKRYYFYDSFVNKCLYHEKLFDRLVNNLNSYDELMKYVPLLKDDYPQDLLEKCENYINGLDVSSLGSYKYYKITDILDKMLTINGGKDIVPNYVKYYRKEYPRRRNFMRLLDKFNVYI